MSGERNWQKAPKPAPLKLYSYLYSREPFSNCVTLMCQSPDLAEVYGAKIAQNLPKDIDQLWHGSVLFLTISR
jgi:hypothetical protein